MIKGSNKCVSGVSERKIVRGNKKGGSPSKSRKEMLLASNSGLRRN
jgi:hypothetical protein